MTSHERGLRLFTRFSPARIGPARDSPGDPCVCRRGQSGGARISRVLCVGGAENAGNPHRCVAGSRLAARVSCGWKEDWRPSLRAMPASTSLSLGAEFFGFTLALDSVTPGERCVLHLVTIPVPLACANSETLRIRAPSTWRKCFKTLDKTECTMIRRNLC